MYLYNKLTLRCLPVDKSPLLVARSRVLKLVTLTADHQSVNQSLRVAVRYLLNAALHGHRFRLVQ